MKQKILKYVVTSVPIALALILAACGGGDQGNTFVTTKNSTLIAANSLPLAINGVSVCNKNQSQGYTDNLGIADFATIKAWKFNAVRLCIFWDGLEPQPGVFDTAYLQRIKNLVSLAKSQGLLVLLDMHQDLYSVKFSDGAPLWATLDGGQPNPQVSDWNDSYYISPAVQTALDNFWANAPASDGVGLQDHYAKAWAFVANAFADEPAVLGYDLMNEPFPGQQAGAFFVTMLSQLSNLMAARPDLPHPSADDLIQMELDPTGAGALQIFQWISDINLYTGAIDAGAPIINQFETGSLMPFYNRVAQSIRTKDNNHVLFIEPSMASNLGVATAISPIVGAGGARDPLQAFAPHVYDIVTDTPFLNLASPARTNMTIARYQSFATKNNLPVLVGEWGDFGQDPLAVPIVTQMKAQFSAAGFGNMYWAYRPGMNSSPSFSALTAGN